MKTFFTLITSDYWVEKNKAYTTAKVVARKRDRMVILESDLDAFLKEFQADIDAVNSEFKRCKDLQFGHWEIPMSGRNHTIYSAYITGVFIMEIIEIKGFTKAVIDSFHPSLDGEIKATQS